MMDKIGVHQNIFIAMQEPNSDITVLAIKLNIELLAKLREGPKYLHGQTQEVNT